MNYELTTRDGIIILILSLLIFSRCGTTADYSTTALPDYGSDPIATSYCLTAQADIAPGEWALSVDPTTGNASVVNRSCGERDECVYLVWPLGQANNQQTARGFPSLEAALQGKSSLYRLVIIPQSK